MTYRRRETDPMDEADSGSDGHRRGEPRIMAEFVSEEFVSVLPERPPDGATVDITSVVDLPDGTYLQYWSVAGVSVGRVMSAVNQFPTTLNARLLSTVDGTHRVEVHGSADSLFSAFDAFDGATRSVTYEDGTVRVVADLPQSADIAAVTEAVQEVYPGFELASSWEVWTRDVVRRLVDEALTDRQRTALRIAYAGGYYEQPRVSTGAELADRMGISKQAFHDHLRKAHARILEQILGPTAIVPIDR